MAAVVVGWTVVSRQHHAAEESLCARYQMVARHLALCEADGGGGRDRRLESMLSALSQDPNAIAVVLYGDGGNALHRRGGAARGPALPEHWPDPPPPSEATTEVGPPPGGLMHGDGHIFDSVAPFMSEAGGHARVRFTTRAANAQLLSTAWTGGAIVVVIMAVALIVAWTADRRIRSIIDDLSGAARRISEGDLDQRLDVRTGDDFEAVATTFNVMVGSLQETRAELDAVLSRQRRATAAAESLAASREELAAVGLLAAGTVHEVGNPLASISGVVQRLQASETDGDRRGRLAVVLEQVHRIERILGDLRTMARPQASSPGDVVALEPVIGRAVELALSRTEARGIEVRWRLPESVPPVRGSSDRLAQVFLNIALNAVQAMPQGGTLTVSARIEPDEVCVALTDTGQGMDPEAARQVFNPFFTTKHGDERAGAGLGLAISYGTIRALGGRLEAASAPGEGATFTVRLPRAAGPADPS